MRNWVVGRERQLKSWKSHRLIQKLISMAAPLRGSQLSLTQFLSAAGFFTDREFRDFR